MTESVYIAAGARTPMGGMQGCFSDLSAVDLGSAAIAEAIAKTMPIACVTIAQSV